MNKHLAELLENIHLLDDYSSFRVLLMLIEKHGMPDLSDRVFYVPVPRWVDENPDISVDLKETLSHYAHLCIKDVVHLYPQDESLRISVIHELRQKLGMGKLSLNAPITSHFKTN